MNAKQELIDNWISNKIITDSRVIRAFIKVNREDFLPKELKKFAYVDCALPIGRGQTISQPTTVMLMTQALKVLENQKIFEIGTGSGYQAAILAELNSKGKIYTTEIVQELCIKARQNLKAYKNITVLKTDGSQGLKKHAPFDRIIMTAACKKIPLPLIQQLKNKGIIVAPVGAEDCQKVVVAVKDNGVLKKHSIGEFVFVPLTGKYGFKS